MINAATRVPIEVIRCPAEKGCSPTLSIDLTLSTLESSDYLPCQNNEYNEERRYGKMTFSMEETDIWAGGGGITTATY